MFTMSKEIKIALGVVVALFVVGGGSFFLSYTFLGFADVREAVSAVLKESSISYRHIKKGNTPDDVFCGELNLKNAEGNPTGYHSFVLIGHQRVIIMDEQSRDKDQQEGLVYFKNDICPGAIRQ
jgi:hypothetical protein